MKKIYYSILSLLVMFFIMSFAIKQRESKELFEKIVFIEVNLNEDSSIFTPYSKAWDESWNYDSDITVNDSYLMNYEKYKFSFTNRTENLWTILNPMIIDGTIQSYWPYSPYAFQSLDDGELRYPFINKAKNETFLTSDSIRHNLSYCLGKYGPESDIPLSNQYGEDSIIMDESGVLYYLYPPRDFSWYTDRDIEKYKLRVSILVNKDGKEQKRVIKAICPVVNRISESSGDIEGENELLWLNFEELAPYLKNAYFFNKDWKPVFYYDYFLQKVKNAEVRPKK